MKQNEKIPAISQMARPVVGLATHTGMVRHMNEDRIQTPGGAPDAILAERGWLYVVADGMGGHNAGEVASELAAQTIHDVFYNGAAGSLEDRLRAGLEEAQRRIAEEQTLDPEKAQMGSTAVGVAFAGNQAIIFNVGDSRCYLLRDGALSVQSVDHSWVAERLRDGALSLDETKKHPYRNIITRALGQPSHTPELKTLQTQPGDVFLLCSDGLWDMVDDATIAKTLTSLRPQQAAEKLIELANAQGGSDNISAVVAGIPKTNPLAAPSATGMSPATLASVLAGALVLFLCALLMAGGPVVELLFGDSGASATQTPAPTRALTSLPTAIPTLVAPVVPALPSATAAPTQAPAMPTSAPVATQIPTVAPTPTIAAASASAIWVCDPAHFDTTTKQCQQDMPVVTLRASDATRGVYASWSGALVGERNFTITWQKMPVVRVAVYTCAFGAGAKLSCAPQGKASMSNQQSASNAYVQDGDSLLTSGQYRLSLSLQNGGIKEKVFSLKMTQ